MYRLNDLERWLAESFLSLLRGDLDGLRKTCYQVTSTDIHRHWLRKWIACSNLNLNILCGTLTDQDIVLLTHVTNDCFVEVVTCDLDRSRYYRSAKGDHCDISCTTTDINDHITAWTGDVDTSTDGSCDRLLDNGYLTSTCCIGSILNSTLLNLCYTRWYADRDTRLTVRLLTNCLLDEILNHLLCYGVIRDNTLTKRTNSYDITRSTSQHETSFLTDCLNLISVMIKSDNGWFL